MIQQLTVLCVYLPGELTHVDHLLQTLGADSVQTAQQFGLPAARVVAIIADFTLEFLQRVHQRLSPGLHLNAAQQQVSLPEHIAVSVRSLQTLFEMSSLNKSFLSLCDTAGMHDG